MRPTVMSTHPRHRRSLLAGTAIVLAVLLVGCGGGGGTASSDSAGAASKVARDGMEVSSRTGGRQAFDGPNNGASGANRPAVQTRAVIKTGEIAVVSDDLDRVHGEVERLVDGLDGYVASEDTTNDRDGSITDSVLKVRMPVASFAGAVEAVSAMGKVKYASSGEKDVTTKVIDVGSRVQTTEKSLRRLRAFLARSTDVGELVRLENEITSRESELESLKAQQDYLSNQTSMATLTVYLSTPEEYVAPPGALEDAGFVAGLRGGWNALVDTVVVALTAIGAFLPFGLALTLIGIPVLWLVRRLRRTPAEPEPEPSGP